MHHLVPHEHIVVFISCTFVPAYSANEAYLEAFDSVSFSLDLVCTSVPTATDRWSLFRRSWHSTCQATRRQSRTLRVRVLFALIAPIGLPSTRYISCFRVMVFARILHRRTNRLALCECRLLVGFPFPHLKKPHVRNSSRYGFVGFHTIWIACLSYRHCDGPPQG